MPSVSRPPEWVWVWAALSVAVLAARPALPIDETRYLAVAWEMWWRGSVAVPVIDGAFYTGKPPLMFWLMELGWLVFGVNAWWPRLIAPLFGLGSLFMVRALARRLWPGDAAAGAAAPWLLLGSLLWAGFCASTMFDMALGLFSLASIYALTRAWQSRGRHWYVAAGLALGLGILAKGPVALLPAFLVVLTAPWWMKPATGEPIVWRAWTLGGLAALGVAALVALAWLVPMALQSDADYLREMVIRQTVNRTVASFAHRRPVWWYLPLLPLVLFPWALWPSAWRALGRLRTHLADPGVRLCLAWAATVFIAFSLISGKQAHYLLLAFPGVALLLARLLPQVAHGRDASVALPAFAYGVGAAALFAAAAGWLPRSHLPWVANMPGGVLYAAGALLLAIAALVLSACSRALAARIGILAASACAALIVASWALLRVSWPAYDVRPMSAYLAALEARGAPVVAVNRYDAQFNFYGRLKAPIRAIRPEDTLDWARAHPGGYVLVYYHSGRTPPAATPAPAFRQLYDTGIMVAWSAVALLANARLVRSFSRARMTCLPLDPEGGDPLRSTPGECT
jgi:4-amino-4-deoxy-L-arabinose transferase-like glycosyltransferase